MNVLKQVLSRSPFSTMRSSFCDSLRWGLLFSLVPLVLIGCDLTGTNEETTTTVTDVVVANSGNFTSQDGSLTLYNPSDSSATFRDLDVAFINSLTLRDDRLFVIDNTQSDNAGRITTFDTENLESVDQIENPRPPRFLAFPSGEKGYVTNLSRDDDPDPLIYDPKPSTVSVVDLEANEVTKRVDVGRSPEGLAVVSGKAFVANQADGTLSVLDTGKDVVTNTIDLSCTDPREVFVDEEKEVTVVCQGETSAEVLFLNSDSEEIVDRVSLDAPVGSSNGTSAAHYSEKAEELYAVSGAQAFGNGTGEIFRVNTDANALDVSFDVPQNDGLIGISAVGYDAINQDLYVTRLPVNDSGGPLFTANGTALVLDRTGALITRFETGNSPGHITFLRDAR